MTYDFYADSEDAINVLGYIFHETDLQLFDSYSDFGRTIETYKSVAQITEAFNLERGRAYSIHLKLWSPRHKGRPILRRLEIDPAKCDGHTFRYSSNGWGLIQLYFYGVTKNGLSPSHIGHFEERGAFAREGIPDFMGCAGDWDWSEIRRTSRKLKYHIQTKLAGGKVSATDSRDVLPGAKKLFDSGITRLHA